METTKPTFEDEVKKFRKEHELGARVLSMKQDVIDGVSDHAMDMRQKSIDTGDSSYDQLADMAISALNREYQVRDLHRMALANNTEAAGAHKDEHYEAYWDMAQADMHAALESKDPSDPSAK